MLKERREIVEGLRDQLHDTEMAVEAALGERLLWWLVNQDQTVVLCRTGERYESQLVVHEAAWVAELRRLSYEE